MLVSSLAKRWFQLLGFMPTKPGSQREPKSSHFRRSGLFPMNNVGFTLGPPPPVVCPSPGGWGSSRDTCLVIQPHRDGPIWKVRWPWWKAVAAASVHRAALCSPDQGADLDRPPRWADFLTLQSDSDSAHLGESLGICISNKLPVLAHAAGPRALIWGDWLFLENPRWVWAIQTEQRAPELLPPSCRDHDERQLVWPHSRPCQSYFMWQSHNRIKDDINHWNRTAEKAIKTKLKISVRVSH